MPSRKRSNALDSQHVAATGCRQVRPFIFSSLFLSRGPDLIPASMYHKDSVGPFIQSTFAKWCCPTTKMIQVCSNFVEPAYL
jgi:hypothetical protein